MCVGIQCAVVQEIGFVNDETVIGIIVVAGIIEAYVNIVDVCCGYSSRYPVYRH
jgi:hypothetical protein